MDCLDDIREASRIGYAGSSSIMDVLLEANWCFAEDLQSAFDILEEWNAPSATTFFQLPYPIRLPERWIELERPGKEVVKVFFRTVGAGPNIINRGKKGSPLICGERANFGDIEAFVNAWIPGDRTGRFVCTQVLISYRLWGWRAELFQSYLRGLNANQYQEEISFRGGHLEHDGRRVTAANFEIGLAERLRAESLAIMKHLLPLYAVACLDPNATAPSYLHNFFTMSHGGRLVVHGGAGHSFLASSVRPFEFENYGQNLGSFLNRLQSPRPISVYENYLLQAVRQVEEKETGLAIVYTVMILEWFVNEMIRAHLLSIVEKSLQKNPALLELVLQRIWPEGKEKYGRRNVSVTEKIDEYLPLIGIELRDSLKRSVKKVITKRNDIIHTNQTQIVDKEEALKAIRVGIQFITTVMKELQKIVRTA